MTERDPRMLTGIPSIVSNVIGEIAALQFIVVLLLALPADLILEVVVKGNDHAASTFGLVLLIDFALGAIPAAIFLPLSRVKQRRELRAGYTTMLTEFNQVDGISWRTGQVVRPAIRPSAALSTTHGFTSGAELGNVDLGKGAIAASFAMPWFDLTIGLSALALIGGAIGFEDLVARNSGNTGLIVGLFFLAFAGFCGALIAPILAAVFYLPRYYRRRLASYFPDATVFIAAPDSLDVVAEVLGADPRELPHARRRGAGYVVVESETLALFSRYRRTAVPYLTIPRSRIAEAAVGSTSSYWMSNNLPYPDVALTVTKDNDTPLTIQLVLAITKGGINGPQLKNDCDFVVDWARSTAPRTADAS